MTAAREAIADAVLVLGLLFWGSATLFATSWAKSAVKDVAASARSDAATSVVVAVFCFVFASALEWWPW